MVIKTALIASMIAGLTVATAASARTTSDEGVSPHRVAHKHHVARNRNPAVQSDVPQEQAQPQAAKPDEVPETFYHASGADGSHVGE